MASGLAVSAQSKQTFQFVQRDSALFLDVWTPATPRPDSACVVALFGGGFVIGERDDSYQREVARVLTERGFTVVSPDYRLGLKDRAPVRSSSGASTSPPRTAPPPVRGWCSMPPSLALIPIALCSPAVRLAL